MSRPKTLTFEAKALTVKAKTLKSGLEEKCHGPEDNKTG